MNSHPDQENRNIREIEARYDDNETPAETEVQEELSTKGGDAPRTPLTTQAVSIAAPTSHPEARQSDTPRTKEAYKRQTEWNVPNAVYLECESLERELAAVTAERDTAVGEEARWSEALNLKAHIIRDLERQREERYDCHAGPGTTQSECGTCLTCKEREIARLKEELECRTDHFNGVTKMLCAERDALRQADLWSHTCVHHNDAERRAITCPACLARERDKWHQDYDRAATDRDAMEIDRDSLAAKLAEKTAQLEAACKQLESLAEDVESVTVEHAACEAKLTEAHERISWLEQQREVECQQKEAALAESSESLRETEATKANFVEAQKDTERLDWLRVYIKSCFLIGLQDQAIQILLGDDVRADIDAAKGQP